MDCSTLFSFPTRRSSDLRASRIQPVINGTGVVIHTNLGRSPLPPGAGEALRNIASSYSNVELNLTTGDRGHRGAYLDRKSTRLNSSHITISYAAFCLKKK